MSEDLVVTPNLTIPAADLRWVSVRASGAGGQNVNKVSTKVQLWFALARSEALSNAEKARLRVREARRIDREGFLLVTCQETRDRSTNLERARELLAAMIRAALVVPKIRTATKPTRASRRRRLTDKRMLGEKKSGRRSVPND